MLVVNSRIRIPDSELEFSYVRSSGPGGQNVNKVSSKAVLRWNAAASGSLPADVRQRFLAKYRSRLTTDGELAPQQSALPRSAAQRGRRARETARHAGFGRRGPQETETHAPHERLGRTPHQEQANRLAQETIAAQDRRRMMLAAAGCRPLICQHRLCGLGKRCRFTRLTCA